MFMRAIVLLALPQTSNAIWAMFALIPAGLHNMPAPLTLLIKLAQASLALIRAV